MLRPSPNNGTQRLPNDDVDDDDDALFIHLYTNTAIAAHLYVTGWPGFHYVASLLNCSYLH